VLELRGGGQQDVGVVRGVGLEVIHHHREEILARKPGDHLVGVRAHRHRVVVVDDDGAHRRLGARQRIAEPGLIDDAWTPPAEQIGALERGVVEIVEVGGREDDAASRVAPGADERRQAGDGARGDAAAGVALHAVVEADGRRPHAAVVAGQLHDLVGADAAGARRPFRGVLPHALGELAEAERVPGDVIAIDQLFSDEDMHHAERERSVGARLQRHVLGALLGREAAIGIDGHDFGAAPLRFLHPRPQMQVRHDRVRAPEDDELRLVEALRVHANRAAKGRPQAELARGRAQRALEQRRAQAVEEAPVHRAVLHHAHRPGVAAGKDRLRVLRRQRFQPRRDLVQRLIPGNSSKFPPTLPPGSFHRVAQAVRRVGALEVVRNLGAQGAVGERHRWVALDLGRHAVLHGDQHGAGVGTIVRAGDADDFGAHAGILRRSASSSSSIQWRTGTPAPPCRWLRQPIFAVAIQSGPASCNEVSLRLRSSPAIAGCSSE
jgi:hypothetical protein